MRVTSQIWVSAQLRRAQAAGAFATVVRKGNAEAGAIFVVVDDYSGALKMYGPSPQAAYVDDGIQVRQFECILEDATHQQVSEKTAREASFDPDIWLIEIEDRLGRTFFPEEDLG